MKLRQYRLQSDRLHSRQPMHRLPFFGSDGLDREAGSGADYHHVAEVGARFEIVSRDRFGEDLQQADIDHEPAR